MTKGQLWSLTHALNTMEMCLGVAERWHRERHLPTCPGLINLAGYLKTAQMIANDALHRARYPEEPGGKLS